MATARIGISGYVYQHWRGAFYPQDLAQRRWLEYSSRRFNSIELNGTFYSLKSPSIFAKWAAQTPDENFVFAIKGSRFITHHLKLRGVGQALANFLASGVFALGQKCGPFLWQLPASDRFDRKRLEDFLNLLPRTTEQAAKLARGYDERLRRGALVEPLVSLPLRHALEVRHESYDTPEFFELLQEQNVAFVLADTAGKFLWADRITADFVYARLHGDQQLYISQYTDPVLDGWSERVSGWLDEGRDVFVYFDNDGLGHAPYDAMRLAQRIHGTPAANSHPGAGFTGRIGSG